MEQGRRATDRKAVGLLVKLKHSDVGSFAEEFATNLSPGGMFIRSRTPQPVGTLVKFEVQIAGGVRVLRGTAVVRWVREAGDPEGPPGMGLQFQELDPVTQALIDRMLQLNKASAPGGAPKQSSEALALEKEMLAKGLLQRGGPPAAPGALPSIAPVVAPVKPVVPPAATSSPPPPGARPMEDADLSALADLGAKSLPPAAILPPLPTPPPVPPGSVDIMVDELLASSPSPAPQEVKFEVLDEPMPDVDFEMESLGGDLPVAMGMPLEDLPVIAPPPAVPMAPPVAPPPPAPPVAQARPAAPPLASADFDVDLGLGHLAPKPLSPNADELVFKPGKGVEFDLDLGDGSIVDVDEPGDPRKRGARGRASPRSAQPSAMPPASSRPAPPPAARAPAPPPARPPPPAPVAPPAPAAPPVASAPEALREPPKPLEPLRPLEPLPEGATQVLPSPPTRPVPPEPLSTMTLPRTIFLPPPQPVEGTGPVIGIDLGTTNSCVAIMTGGRPSVLSSKEGYNTIPSVISLNTQGKLLVSHRARNQMVLRPTQSIYGAKRLVGRPYDSAVVKQVRERFHYEIVPDAAGRAAVRLGEHVLSLEEVQGLILRECKEMAQQHLGQKVERAVVTVPAYYSEPQREAVRKAGMMAGLKVERILNEPTSAALAYGLNRELNKRVLVYDLGGGTFDATILRIEKNVFEVLSTGGDIFLGGIDFDNALVDFLLERFQQLEGIPFMGDGTALSRVSDAAEKAKIALSERNHHEVHIPMLMVDEIGRPRDLRFTMTRADLERLSEPLVTRTLDVVRDVLLDARLKPSDIDDIILVGGQSRMPLVRDKLKALFGKTAHASVNADEAVALGAAMYSTALGKVSSVVLIDVLPMTIGLALPGGGFQRVIERNSPLPAQRSFAVSTVRDNEEVLELSLFQGEDTHISANEYLGTVRLEGLPKGPKGSVRVAVTIKLDAECVLFVEAREYTTRKSVQATLATRYTPDELAKQLKVDASAAKAAEERRGADLKERAGRFWSFLKKVVSRS